MGKFEKIEKIFCGKMTNAFITNVGENTLSKKLENLVPKSTALDVLVGFFRFSGFFRVKNLLHNPEKIRILVGMGADEKSISAVMTGNQLSLLPNEEKKEEFLKNAIKDFSNAKQTSAEFAGLHEMIEMISSGKLEIRAYMKQPLHAKMYLFSAGNFDSDGILLTGSSNLSISGLEGNLELNAILRDPRDFAEGKNLFETLWQESVEISEMLSEKIQTETWLLPATPAEIFYRAVYEYLGAERTLIPQDFSDMPESFRPYEYQADAVAQVVENLRQVGGCFLADVVGLGKTVMGMLVARELQMKNLSQKVLVLCPPGLVSEWERWADEFRIRRKVFSSGNLENVVKNKKTLENVDFVILDESHNFRNKKTETYAHLEIICRGKKVLLLSATPQTKSPKDLEAQIRLFADPYDFSYATDGKSLSEFFKDLEKENSSFEKGQKLKKLLKEMMVRRTRSEVQKEYAKDLEKQNLSFPKTLPPEIFGYALEKNNEDLLQHIEEKIGSVGMFRFKPKRYILQEFQTEKRFSDLVRAGEQLAFAYKFLLFKRLESSVVAAKATLSRLKKSNEDFLKLLEKQEFVPFGLEKMEIAEMLENDEMDFLAETKLNKNYEKKCFNLEKLKEEFLADAQIFSEIEALLEKISPEKDGKLQKLLAEILENVRLKDKKILIFSESKETAEYLSAEIAKKFPQKKVEMGSSGMSKNDFSSVVKRFAPKANKEFLLPREHEIDVLVATDAFSEGLNLHDGNIVINYDLPWNPVRIIQRAGRVNRVGTEHTEIFVFNFFPDPQIDEYLRRDAAGGTLRERIQKRINDFHSIIGDDIQYLSDEEKPEPKNYYQSPDDLEKGEENQFSTTALRILMKNLREENPSFFQKIVSLSSRAWTASKIFPVKNPEMTVVCRRKERIEFFGSEISSQNIFPLPPEMAFARLFAQMTENATLEKPPEFFGKILEKTEQFFENLQKKHILSSSQNTAVLKGNSGFIIKKIREVKKFVPFEMQEELLRFENIFLSGSIAAESILKNIKKELEISITAPEVLEVLKKFAEDCDEKSTKKNQGKPEIVLSAVHF